MEQIEFKISGNDETIVCFKGNLNLTQRHYYTGDTLEWVYNEGSYIESHMPIITKQRHKQDLMHVKHIGETYADYPFGISCRIYNEKAQNNVLKFEFGKDNTEFLSFLYKLNFKGWKEISLPYERGYMKGIYSADMNYFRISALGGGGRIYFSEINLCKNICPNHIYKKMSPQIENLPLPTRRGPVGALELHSSSLNRPIFLSENFSVEYKRAFDIIEKKYFELMDETDNPPFIRGNMKYDDALSLYHIHNIQYADGVVTGNPIKKTALYAKAMKTFATEVYQKNKQEDAERFILMWRHLQDQNTPINWYHGRGVASGMLMMKEELKKRGLLEEAIEYLKKSYDFSRIYQTASRGTVSYARYEDTDVIGMDLPSTLVCILLAEDTPEKISDMKHLVYYIENFCLGYAPGLASGYKPDGTAFHHCGYIRQYETVANYSMSRILYMLSNTAFMVGEEAVDRFINILKTFFTVSNGVYEPFTVCQYAFDAMRDTSAVDFAHTAKALKNKELARMYVSLAMCSEKEQKNKSYKEFIDSGITPIENFCEHKTLSYAAAAFHCRDNWKLAVRGHSKYVYPMEIWPDETGEGARPGARYTAFSLFRSFGFLELMYPPEYEGGTNNSIHIDKGFDFCRWPGSTSVHIPLYCLKSLPLMVEDEMSEWLLSDRTFVGGIDTEDKNGVFAMQLHGPYKYGLESFEATKTYHFYNDMVVCLGSDIKSEIAGFNTETTLFQDYGNGAIRNNNFLTDNRGNSYLVFDGDDKIDYYTEKHTSRDVKDHSDTEGIRTFAVINHGISPKNAHYAYLMKVNDSDEEKIRNDFEKNISVIKQDRFAHIVRLYNKTNYVFFAKNYDMEDKWINSVSQSCIISVTEQGDKVSLGVCDPDLRFYLGESEDYDLNRNKLEKSIYGRFWIAQESMPSRVWVVLNCTVEEFEVLKGNAQIISSYPNKTIMEFICKDGLSNEIVFKKSKTERIMNYDRCPKSKF